MVKKYLLKGANNLNFKNASDSDIAVSSLDFLDDSAIIDIRPRTAYLASHIVNSINLTTSANIFMRMALKMQNAMGSRITDEGGAEKLLGPGDMLIKINGEITHIFLPPLNPNDIKQILKIKGKK
mgnify:CR=1 FL=1